MKKKSSVQKTKPEPTADGKLHLLGAGHTRYPASPDEARLEAFPNRYAGRDYLIQFDCPEFTCLCPITGQPDFGRIQIEYVADKLCLESKSLKLYLFSYRSHPGFHEAVVNRMLDDIVRAIRPRRLRVRGVFNPRGGIALTVTACWPATSGLADGGILCNEVGATGKQP